MQSVRSRDTGPEFLVRHWVHKMGFRYKLHCSALPGWPDLVFPGRRKIIFVHGCFWHGHGCHYGRPPKSNLDFWLPKLARNKERDEAAIAALKELGWEVLVVWQCEIRG